MQILVTRCLISHAGIGEIIRLVIECRMTEIVRIEGLIILHRKHIPAFASRG